MLLRTQLTVVAGRPVLAVSGELDLASLPTFHHRVAQAVRQHAGATLWLDLDGLAVADDAGLSVVLASAAQARRNGGELRIVAGSPVLRARIADIGLDRILGIDSAITDA